MEGPAQPQLRHPGLSQHLALPMLLTPCITPDLSLGQVSASLQSSVTSFPTPVSLPHTSSLPGKSQEIIPEMESSVFAPSGHAAPAVDTAQQQPWGHPALLSIPIPHLAASTAGAGSFPIIAVSAEFTARLQVINNNGLTLK